MRCSTAWSKMEEIPCCPWYEIYMTVVSAQLEASLFIPTLQHNYLQIVLHPYVHPRPRTPTQKLPWQTNTIHIFLYEVQHARQSWVWCHSLQRHPALPPFTGGGKNFKGWHRKWKGTLFIRPRRETYRGSASALNQPRLLDMLNRRVAERRSGADWSEARRVRDGDRNRRRFCETEGDTRQRDTADKSNLAMPHLCKSHLIFPLTYF